MPNESILFLIACSNGKQKGGEHHYKEDHSLAKILPEHSKKLFESRLQVYKLIKEAKIERNGVLLDDLPYNRELLTGKDFGGDSTKGEYLEAIQRYQGRFYRELSRNEADPVVLLKRTDYHFLIISGLYGLLTPLEPIQLYSCDVNDHPSIANTWTKDDILTSLLLAYIRKFNINILIDLISVNSHRNLLNWDRIRKRIPVFRAFGNQNMEASLLPALGSFMRKILSKEISFDLSDLEKQKPFYTDFEEIIFSKENTPPDGFLKGEINHEYEEMEGFPKDDSMYREIDISALEQTSSEKKGLSVTSLNHNTIFDKRINSIKDLPPEVRPIFHDLENHQEILRIKLGRFSSKMPKSQKYFSLKLKEPEINSGFILGKLKGPGKIGGIQHLLIETIKGKEWNIYLSLRNYSWAEY